MAGRIAPKVIIDGLVLYLDAANTKSYVSGSTRWNDMSRRENNGTLVNGPTFNSANGGYIVLDGIDDYYQLGNFAFDTSTSFTISCWFKRNVLTNMNTKFLLKTLNDGVGRIWFGGIDTDNIYGRLENNTYYGAGGDYWQTVTTNLKDGNWYNVVMVHNKTSLQQKSYLNGVLAATKVLTGAYDNPSSPMRSTQVNSSVSNLLIYNRALTDVEVLQNYNVLKARYSFTTSYLNNLVGYYPLNSNANDLSGKGYNGTVVGTPTYSIGKVSNAIDLGNNTTLNYINIPDNSDFSFTNGTNDLPFSFSMWINITAFSVSVGGWLINKRGDTNGTDEWQILFDATGKVSVVKFQYDLKTNYQSIVTTSSLSTATWYHVCITDAGTANINDCKIYINGSLAAVTRTTTGTYTRMNNGTAITRIGMSAWATNPDLKHKGLIDELAIWKNRELSSSEVVDLYNKGLSGQSII